MDTQLTTVAERAAQIRTQVAGLVAQKQKTEGKLAEEHGGIRRAALKRGELIESLTGANVADSRAAHRGIDELDSAIRVSERLAESLQKALAKTVQEIEVLHAELAEAERAIRAEERAKALEAFQINLKQAARRAGETLDSARADLAALNARTVAWAATRSSRPALVLRARSGSPPPPAPCSGGNPRRSRS